VLGIGNPGPEYAKTRHNAGFDVLDALARDMKVRISASAFGGQAFVAAPKVRGEAVLLVKPQTYVNLSGDVAYRLLTERGVDTEDLLVVCDDLSLAVGKIRLRSSGGSGGHKGLTSIIAAIENDSFPRLRVGIGANPPGVDSADYVLERIPESEQKEYDGALKRAAEAVSMWLSGAGLVACMNRYN
jgi:PTH1 family peptidyl-tRNA hydrolase